MASKTQYKLIIEKGTAYINYFSSATPNDNPVNYEIWKDFNQETQLFDNQFDIEKALIEDGNNVFFGPVTATLVNFVSVPCNVSAVSGDYFKVSIAWPTQKNFPFLASLNFHLTKIKETGQLERIMRKYLSSHNVACESSDFKPIEIFNIFTAFLLLLVGVLFAVIAAVSEKCFLGHKKNSEKRLFTQRKH